MAELTGRERYDLLMHHKKPDRIGLYEHFWGDTHRKWTDEGKISKGFDLSQHFGFDCNESWCLNFAGNLDYKNEVVAEDEDTITVKNQNYAILRSHKKHDSTPEHVGFTVDCRDKWEELIKHHIKAEDRRIGYDGYRNAKKYAADNQIFFQWSGINVFEIVKDVCGHENLLMAMIDDPDWVHDMVNTFADANIGMWEMLFAKEGKPDGIWYYEDLGYKGSPFMSPAMYREFIMPAHIKTFAAAHAMGLPVMVHSCGYVYPLLPHMIEAGMDGLQVIEIKAGMDLLKIHKEYGDKIALMGGIDVRALYTNDRAIIDKELEAKIPIVKQGFAYMLHSDHSIPNTVDYDTYRYFVDRALEMGGY
ncbi:hypothetical protein FACS1894105_14300 [Clostridia bacterium]|nr:hypothetical protein FACS1894105_14300 [Clostridia bacterium]